MLMLEINKFKKYHGDRLILDIDKLKIDSSDRIGIIGVNGAGKSTLLNIITKKEKYDEGTINLYGSYSYMEQLSENVDENNLNKKLAEKLGVNNLISENKSGGEITKLKIAKVFAKKCEILIADEPTSNLDIESIELLEKSLKSFAGSILIVSHDRNLLDNICNKILEIEFGKINLYKGNYSDFLCQKEHLFTRANFEYEKYIKEKKRLEKASIEACKKSNSIKNAPKRMGNSEARLHKRGIGTKKAKIEKVVKNIEKRIEKLESKEKPNKAKSITLDVQKVNQSHSKIIIEGNKVSKSFGDRILFQNVDFKIPNKSKVALIGNNGTGKTTLIRMILNRDSNIKISPTAKIAYFDQKLSILDENKSILENVMESTSHDETFVRIVLSRLLIFRDNVYKKISVLSGGEKVKVSLAKILLMNANVLILDEPSNYLDIKSQEALEELLKEYKGTIIFVSHDRTLIKNTANSLLILENNTLTTFNGTYNKYLQYKESSNFKEKLMLLETELSMVIGKLSLCVNERERAELDNKYYELLSKIKTIKH